MPPKKSPPKKSPKKEANKTENNTNDFVAVKDEPEENLSFEERVAKTRVETAPSVLDFNFNKKRVRILSDARDVADGRNAILYWMFREQRAQDNWALLYAQRLALKLELPLVVVHCVLPSFLGATLRHYHFSLEGLKETSQDLLAKNIQLHELVGEPHEVISSFVKEHNIGAVVVEMFPLRVAINWTDKLIDLLPRDVPVAQVDAHNIVPVWIASDKLEYAARTIRNKINTKLPEFLTYFPDLAYHPHNFYLKPKTYDYDKLLAESKVDQEVGPSPLYKPGPRAGLEMLRVFIEKKLPKYSTGRNDPSLDALSNLSPWFHFGQLAPQRAILEVQRMSKTHREPVAIFTEEAVVRRELADNFCFYNPNYDSIDGAYDWAKETLRKHAKDKRPYLYTEAQLAKSKTHDDLWNAAQTELTKAGKMHGYMRMYWAKKILEWTESPEEALRIAIKLNDTYSLDGRDPNGYVGCMWSICGIHDQGWVEREIFGKIRYMNYNGCKRKFDIARYVGMCRRLK